MNDKWQKKRSNVTITAVFIITLVAAVYWALMASDWSLIGLWLTPDQQGQRLFFQGRYAEAAACFEDPFRRGAMLYRDARFEEAAAAFGRSDTAEAAFNRGNALIMMGKYDEAIASFDRALQARSVWPEALANRRIAVVRRERLKPPEGDQGGIDGDKLGADEIVFDDRPKKTGGGKDQVVEDNSQISDQELRAMWLRRVQTRPADFLKNKFAYQESKRRVDQ